MVVVISGKSGVGKDTIIEYLSQQGFRRYPSLTTRPKRVGEIDGINYHFVAEKDFLNIKKAGELLDCVNISGYYYGFPINGLLNDDSDYVVNMVAESGMMLKRLVPKTFLIYLVFPNKQTQIERLKSRGMSDYEIGIRLRDDPNSDVMPIYYDVELVNYNSQKTAYKIAEMVRRFENEPKNERLFKGKRSFREQWMSQPQGL